jgi:predicted ArsR family transcriptional regulator
MLAMRQDGATLQQVAEAVGVSHMTVQRATESTFPNGKVQTAKIPIVQPVENGDSLDNNSGNNY